HFSTIDIHQPEVSYTREPMEPTQTPRATRAPKEKNISFIVDSIHIRQPRVHLDSKRGSGSVQLQTQIHQINLSQTAFNKTADAAWGLDVGKIYFHAGNTSLEEDSGMRFSFAGLQTTIFDLHKPASSKLAHFNINKLILDSLHFEQEKKDNKTVLDSRLIALTDNTPVATDKDSILNTIYGMPSLELQGTSVLLDNKARVIQFMNVNANLPAKSFSADSFRLQPKMDRDSFFATQPIEKDYISVSSGPIQASTVNIIKDNKDTGFAINKLSLDHFFIKAERDKRRPDDTILYKPLLAKMIQKIPFHFAVDTLVLQNSTVWHNVIAEKTGEEGTIFFTDVNGSIGDLRTFRINNHDSLRIRVYAKLMGKGNLYMRFRQSYSDSLQGFLLAARMGKFDMPDLDRILVPLTRIRIARGVIDTLWLQASANDLLAFGSMEIDYRKLHVEKLDKNEKKQGFISWLANIIVRTRNRKKGTIYVERLQDKAIFNYWGKIALSGLLTNIRVASSKKNKKKYEAALKKYQRSPHLLNEE
ncbi:MAG TPA: hypothetical protein VK543_00175, partial [Puia sp.]|nr:hypothetical protein [Puia sp.]